VHERCDLSTELARLDGQADAGASEADFVAVAKAYD
jgi:hypothetical protein